MDPQTQAREDLAAIRRLMEGGQRVVNTAGPHFVAWGLLTSAALVATYVLGRNGDGRLIGWVWIIAVAVGWVASIALTVAGVRGERVSSPAGRMLGGLWIGAGVTMTLLGFAAPAGGGLAWSAITGVLAAVLGAAYFASGFLVGARWMQGAAGLWWGGALYMLLAPGPQGLLVTAALVVLLEIVPGVLLTLRARRAVAVA